MNDFYADLERQLVDAARLRARRGRWRTALAGRARPLLAAAAVLVALVVGAALVSGVDLGSSSDPSGGSAGSAGHPELAPPTQEPVQTIPAAAPPAAAGSLQGIKVAVLNATTAPGAGRAVADLLHRHGATLTVVANAPEQTLADTRVDHEPVALEPARQVARVLETENRGPITGSDSELAQGADVVVHVGYDRRGR
jgi:hypothetical protein